MLLHVVVLMAGIVAPMVTHPVLVHAVLLVHHAVVPEVLVIDNGPISNNKRHWFFFNKENFYLLIYDSILSITLICVNRKISRFDQINLVFWGDAVACYSIIRHYLTKTSQAASRNSIKIT